MCMVRQIATRTSLPVSVIEAYAVCKGYEICKPIFPTEEGRPSYRNGRLGEYIGGLRGEIF